MSLLADYFKERGTKELIETDKGFATYCFLPEGCYVEDVFVVKSHRGQSLARGMVDEITKIARERGCTKLFSSCVPSSNGATESTKVALRLGFNIYSSKENAIFFAKDI